MKGQAVMAVLVVASVWVVGREEGVRFDLDADGVPERLGWTAEGTLDGFLCWDRDGNGAIDDGRELFGTATPMFGGGEADHGYAALAEIDAGSHGGDGDGVISRSDAHYEDLCVWFDLDHDGMSDDGEMVGLAELGILDLSVEYRSMWRRDRYGNLFRFGSEGRIEFGKAERRLQTYDVFFTTMSRRSE